MFLLVVAGFASGAGKTEIACRLLEALPGWGAIKVSPVHDRDTHGLSGEYEIRSEITDPSPEGSDTWRYRKAGAARTAWVVARRERVVDAAREALATWRGLPGVLLEGNAAAAAVEGVAANAIVLVARAGASEVKPSARPLLARADWLVVNGPVVPHPHEEVARWLERMGGGRARPRLRVLDAAEADAAPTVAFVSEVRAWLRR